MLQKYAVIVAGGEGRRAGGEMPKQFHELLGIPMLWWSVRAFHAEDPETRITIVLHPGFFDDWDILYNALPEADRHIPVRIVAGGRNRSHSVFNGLMGIKGDGLVAIHDAARPLIMPEVITRGWEVAVETGAAVPVIAESNSLRELTGSGSRAVDRTLYVAVQTPQVFRLPVIRKAFEEEDALDGRFTDEASLAEANGYQPTLFDGSPSNIKVTNPDDFIIARVLLENTGGKAEL